MATVTVNGGSTVEGEDKMEEQRQIRKELTCSVCHKLFTDPRTIPCLHTFCKQCIIDSLPATDSNTYCPICRKTNSYKISSIPTNSMIHRAVEILKQNEVGHVSCDNCTEGEAPAVCWCVECNNSLCVKCNNAHSRLKNLTSHKTVPVLELMHNPYKYLSIEESKTCTHHSRRLLEMYCKTCNVMICRDCAFKDSPHQAHDFKFISKAVLEETEKGKLKHTMASLEKSLQQLRSKVMKIEKHEKELDTRHEESNKEIKQTYEEVYKLLKQQEKEVLQKVEATWESLKMTLALQKESIKLLQNQMLTCQGFSNNVMIAEGAEHLLTYGGWIVNRADDLTKQVEHVSNDPDDMIVKCARPTEFVTSLCSVTPAVPLCVICSVVIRPNTTKLVVKLRDVCGSPVLNQSSNLEIRYNKESEFLKDGVEIEEQSDGLYHIRYALERTEDHVMSLYCAGFIVKQEEIKVPASVRDYVNIKKEVMTIDKYGPANKLLKFPYLLCKGPNDEIIVNDDATNQLVIFDRQLKFSHVIDGNGRLQGITGITVDKNGCLYIADGKLNCIKKFKLDGQFIGQFGSTGTEKGQFRTPFGLLVTTSGLLFICDRNNDRIQVFKDEQFSYSIGKYGKQPGCFHGPVDLTMNGKEDKLFVTDFQNHRVQVFTPNGQFLQIFGVFSDIPFELKNPTGIHFTTVGHILISSYSTNRILVFDEEEDGRFVSAIEGTYQGKERFSTPCGIMMKANGQIVVACSDGKHGNRLVVF